MFFPLIHDWAHTTATGDRAELRDLPEELPLWRELSAEADTCLGATCPHYDDCFLTRLRQRAAAADVVIVNHHLLCADAAVRQGDFGEVIPAAPTLVVDEAHQLEDVATEYFGVSFSSARVDDLVRDARHVLAGGGLGSAAAERLARAIERLAEAGRRFFAALSPARVAVVPGGDARVRYTSEAMAGCAEDGFALGGALEDVEEAGRAWARAEAPPPGEGDERSAPDGEEPEGLATILRRAAGMRGDLRLLLRAADDDFVYYLETRGRGTVLRASPVDVSRIVPEALFDRFRSVVLTSATLTVDGSFDYLRRRLGIGAADQLRVPSEFDFARQALLYLPRRMPPPRSDAFAAAVARETVALLTRSRGRAFVLFTSYRMLHAVRPVVEEALPYPVLVQGAAPRSALLERFRSTPHAVLLATSSFWQGVDVAGESLSCVVIDKLPFAVPSDPVTAARIDAITSQGGDAFSEYQVPLAILSLQQGLGRLLRHRADRGVLAVLDPRLGTTGYGRRFLDSLPPAPVTRDLDAVGRFFK